MKFIHKITKAWSMKKVYNKNIVKVVSIMKIEPFKG